MKSGNAPPGQKFSKIIWLWERCGVFCTEIFKILMKGGGARMRYNLKKLEKELLSKIDTTSQQELEKVKRYINLVRIYYELDESIENLGAVIITKNGSQEFAKTNPAIQEKNRINTSLLSIEKSFDFKDKDSPKDGSDLL